LRAEVGDAVTDDLLAEADAITPFDVRDARVLVARRANGALGQGG
jgi:hypothetical protein